MNAEPPLQKIPLPRLARLNRPGFSLLAFFLLTLLAAGTSACRRQSAEPAEPRRERVVRRIPELQVVMPAPEETVPVQKEEEVVESSTSGTEAPSGDGISYHNDWVRNVPWSVNVLKVDRSRADLGLTTSLGQGRVLGLSPLSRQIAAIPPEIGAPLGAINGDFYQTEQHSYAGDPRGLQIMHGELISAPTGGTAFWIDAEGNPNMDEVTSRLTVTWPDGRITPCQLNEERRSREAVLYTPRAGRSTRTSGGRELILERTGDAPWLPLRAGETYRATVRTIRVTGNSRLSGDILVLSLGPGIVPGVPEVAEGAVLEISTATAPDLRGAQMAIGGGPRLLQGGRVSPINVRKGDERHPRTAMGWNDDHFFLVQVDGRQHGFSVGMTLTELAKYMARQGCREAMNLDGGGSSEMWVAGEVVSRPCFGHERSTANALIVVQKMKLAER